MKSLLAVLAVMLVVPSCGPDAVGPAAMPRAVSVREVEPNNSAAAARDVRLGDTLVGSVDPYLDDDYYAIDIPAGTRLRIDRTGSHGRVEVAIFDVDGRTWLGGMLEYEELSREFPIMISGRHYILVNVWDHDDPYPDNIPTPGFVYSVSLARVTPSP